LEFDWSPELMELRERVRSVIAAHLPGDWASSNRNVATTELVHFTKEFCKALAANDLWVPHWPTEFGGRNASLWEQAVIGEELWGVGEPRGPQYMNTNWIAPAIMEFGTQQQKDRYLPPIAAGDVIWCQGFSEPDAGSDLASLRTQAIRDSDVYIVNGQKIWTSYAHVAEHCFLLVRTNPAVPKRQGISVLLVDMDLLGIEVREVPSILADHAVHEVFFSDVVVPADCLLGDENHGWHVTTTALAHERIGVARYERVSRVVDEAVSEQEPALTDEAAIGTTLAMSEAARLLTYVAIQDQISGREATGSVSIQKVAKALTERAALTSLAREAGQEHLVYESHSDAQLVAALPSTITGGTLEVQYDLIARRSLGLPRSN